MSDYAYSIIISHANEGYFLDISLDSISNYIKYKDFEVLIIDDNSKNLSYLDFIEKHPLKDKIKLYKKKFKSANKTRNFGAKMAKGNILLFFDSHVYLNQDVLVKATKLFEKHPDIDIVQPIIGSIGDKSRFGNVYSLFDYSLKMNRKQAKWIPNSYLVETPNTTGAAMFIKKRVFDDLGGFNKFHRVLGLADMEFTMRAWLNGYKCYITSIMQINHYFKSKSTVDISNFDMLYNKIVFVETCIINDKRKKKFYEQLENTFKKVFDKTYDEVVNDKSFLNRKNRVQKKYKYDDDRYFLKFKDYYQNFV